MHRGFGRTGDVGLTSETDSRVGGFHVLVQVKDVEARDGRD